ncbi:MAG: FkbM family methyltransferase [Lentisphaerae bacterium]|nr:FkbM family methyltransferase [Lentisphaerota bacterium]
MNLFDLDELIMFSFYWANRGRYRATLDIGANIGLHSVLMAKCGYEVRSFEPDPTHFAALLRNLSLNGSARVAPENAAVSAAAGEMEFVRVLGNTTGSHLVGSKPGAYGELERFPVRTMAFAPLLEGCDLVKLDVEGHECGVLASTTHRDWIGTDGLISVHDERNAVAVYEHCRDIQVNMFSQKSGWSQIGSINEMPASHHEGSLFLSLSEAMPWT